MRRCPTRAAVVVVGALLCWACGDGPAVRDVVLQRDFEWRVLASHVDERAAERLVVERRWSGTEIEEQWTRTRALMPGDKDTGLLLTGTGYFDLDAPPETLDTRLHHELVVRASGAGLTRLVLRWHEEGGAFADEHSVELPLPPEGTPGEVRLSLGSAMVGRPEGPVSVWRLSVVGEPGRPLSLRLLGIELRSHYAPALKTGLLQMPVALNGVRMEGLCLPVPGAATIKLAGGAGERLVLSAAVVAGASPVTLVLEDSGGLLSTFSVELAGESSWTPLELDLSALAGAGPTTLTLRASGPAALLLVGGVRRMGPGDAPQPNVVFWLVDTLRSDRLSSYGYGPQTDPVLAGLVAAGVRVEHVYAASNWTRPAVSSLLTGVGPEIHGNQVPGARVDPTLPTLAGQLAQAGYLTVSLNTNYQAGLWSGLDKGFDVQFQPRHFPRLDPPTSLTSSQIAGPLAQFLEEHRHEALFLWVHCLDPHGPYVPHDADLAALAEAGVPGASAPEGPPDVRFRFRQRSPAYDAEILNADRELGRLDAQLVQLGLAEDTLLVFSSDHGESFAEHGSWGHWRSLYEEELRVPWVMRWPGVLPAGLTVDSWATHVDLAPTMLGLLSLSVPSVWTGRDLSAAMRGESLLVPETVFIIDTISGGKETMSRRSLAAVGGRWKLIVKIVDAEEVVPLALFNLSDDPHERHDLLPGQAAPGLLLAAVQEHLRRDRELSHRQPAGDQPLDPELQRWLQEMGYLR